MERAKEELDRLTVEPPPNPSEELVRLQLLASVMLEALKELEAEATSVVFRRNEPNLLEKVRKARKAIRLAGSGE